MIHKGQNSQGTLVILISIYKDFKTDNIFKVSTKKKIVLYSQRLTV